MMLILHGCAAAIPLGGDLAADASRAGDTADETGAGDTGGDSGTADPGDDSGDEPAGTSTLCVAAGAWNADWEGTYAHVDYTWILARHCAGDAMDALAIDMGVGTGAREFELVGPDAWRSILDTSIDEGRWTTQFTWTIDLVATAWWELSGTEERAYACTAGDCQAWGDAYRSSGSTAVEDGPLYATATGGAPG